MVYLITMLLLALLVGIGIINYSLTIRKARRLLDQYLEDR